MEEFIEDCNNKPKKALEVALAVFIAIGILVSYLPQHYKIIKTKTSEGISQWFLLLGSISMTCSFFNVLVLSGYQFECCRHEPFSLCFQNTLSIIQLGIQWTMFTMILVLFIAYFPEDRKYIPNISLGSGRLDLIPKGYSMEWRISLQVAASFVFHFFFTLAVSVYLVIFVGGHEDKTTKYWADLLGIISLILASIQYLPQIWKTWKRKSVGALSIPMMLMQTPGSFFFALSLALNPDNRWSTWIVFLITGCLQGTLLIMCICWHFREKRDQSEVPNERTRLLDNHDNQANVIVEEN